MVTGFLQFEVAKNIPWYISDKAVDLEKDKMTAVDFTLEGRPSRDFKYGKQKRKISRFCAKNLNLKKT